MRAKRSIINIIYNMLLYCIIAAVVLQFLITQIMKTKRFSLRACVRNISIVVSIYLTFTKSLIYILCPFLMEIFIELLRFNGYHFDKYVATEYLYSDLFEDIFQNQTKIISNYSEGNYNGLIGFNTENHEEQNIYYIKKWAKETYDESYKKISKDFYDDKGELQNGESIKLQSEINKFKLICDICKINKNMRILEIGFGKTDLMKYIRQNFGISVVGVSISNEQVSYAKANGFEAYHLNSWDMTSEQLGKFDLVLHCGSLEYVRLSGQDPQQIYTNFGNIIKKLLVPGGKYFVTSLHFNPDYAIKTFDFKDFYNVLLLWRGNDGAYPIGKDGYTKYMEQIGFKTIYQEERTNDYFIYSVLWIGNLICGYTDFRKKNYLLNITKILYKTIAAPYYLDSFLTYMPCKDYNLQPWIWQFVPRSRNGKLQSFATLQYILFANDEEEI